MAARMQNPAVLVPEAMQAIHALNKAARKGGVPDVTLELVHMRASQINGCGPCLDMGGDHLRKAGVSDQRIWTLAGWRETPYYSDAERAALALAECVTRLGDRPDAVPDEVWDEAAEHYDEQGLSSLLLVIGVTNLFNRLNVSVRQQAGAWG
ncbi:carboxymuconolactone decarboxylase family protein [Nonomuraea rhizosphaerae]|uniref:carboxymuconolactone decarboxylase family protein n=1 Tax=Nonomuraea rhizosphaerae TaxID=2665663 RepID=UPI001C6054B0|nr:carboxymuconolactone decarboxylase family protein [Nonomuraea rhizosphaerae]